MLSKTAILQPLIPNYRTDFFKGINDKFQCDIFVYQNDKSSQSLNFNISDFKVKKIWNLSFYGFLLYSAFPLLSKRYDTLILMLHFAHLSTWLLLLTKPLHKKKIILWGHGISIKRYIKEEKRPNILLKWMIGFADSVWFYTESEMNIWKKIYPNLNAVSLNNTISELEPIFILPKNEKSFFKKKYNIIQPVILIFCARFTSERRIDLLIKIIESLDKNKFGFIIIGDGELKPDFKRYKNVYDFGSLYDRNIKNELFYISDIYLQPAWTGLSIVEAMAYGKPIFTFERSVSLLQCVEYGYIINNYNGCLFDNLDTCIKKIENISPEEIIKMGDHSTLFVKNNLTMKNMVNKALDSLSSLK
jgi:glycosyltransferase involved in cell wall biosynthesis